MEKGYFIFVAFIAGLITLLHFFVLANYPPLIVFEELYYIPLLLGALWFGLKGALLTYMLVSLLYLPFFFGDWSGDSFAVASRALHLIFSGIFTLTAGFLVDREKKLRQRAEREQYLVSIGQVATTIVHDLKNPIITILGFARRIREGKGNVDIASETIIDSAQNMQKIVHDVLDFSKPVQLNLKEEDIRNVVKQAIDSCRRMAKERYITLSIDMPDYPVNILMDSFQMARALVNLVNNAIEASGKGQHVTVTLSAGKKHLEVSIKDHGSGIDKTTIENIFVPFYTKKTGGTGLGMPIAKKIIDGHKGIIRIDSQPGKGTEVTIVLPEPVKYFV
ncbi:MAG TPA: HAMP domain-containing sensor histidine kinase [Dissulfurispiraceae bacterium]|nr:HAMP domain-containing sensor histidine kinase [Dissulfurispiraceae bacterium]